MGEIMEINILAVVRSPRTGKRRVIALDSLAPSINGMGSTIAVEIEAVEAAEAALRDARERFETTVRTYIIDKRYR
jgi:hypothetical protein